MGLITLLVALGSLILAGLSGTCARAQGQGQTQSGAASLLGHESELRSRTARLESSFNNIVSGDNRSTSSRLLDSSINETVPFQIGRSQRFSFTTGGLPPGVGPMSWKRVYGMLGAYAMHRGSLWGAMPGLSLAMGSRSTMLQATAIAPAGRLCGHSALSLAFRF